MSANFQPSFIEELPQGFRLIRGMVEPATQTRMVELVRELCRKAPLITPRTRFGTSFKLQITSWGEWGWISDERGYRYERLHPVTKEPWPKIPDEVKMVMMAASREASYPGFDLQSVLVNFYDREAGKLGHHQD